MTNREFSEKLELRTKIFSVEIIRFSESLPNKKESLVIRNQVTKSATSIGANYREANRSRSKRDFKNKIKICESEASETLYWLEILEMLNWTEIEKLNKLIKETKELLAIFTSIASKLKTH